MVAGARALVRTENPNVPTTPTPSWTSSGSFYDTERFFDRFAKGRFARPLFDRHEARPAVHEPEATRVLVEEAQLFIDAVHAVEIRESGAQSALVHKAAMGTAAVTEIVRIGAKLYAENPEVIDLPAYIPLFHGWIQGGDLDGVPIDASPTTATSRAAPG